jgi:SagB-type dehydrogenase family enzyme
VKLGHTCRQLLKNDLWPEWKSLERDEKKGIPRPPLQKPYPQDALLIDLVPPEDLTLGKMALSEAINKRRSRRQFTDEPLALEELSFLPWATQGVRTVTEARTSTRRTVPSAGARHPFETYLIVKRVAGLTPGLYRYLPLEHKLCFLCAGAELATRLDDDFWFRPSEAVLFIWAAIPYRTEWKYSVLSPKLIALDAGHVCQNLYLASEAIGAGTCAIGAYWQHEIDAILNADGEDEFAIYVARVGKVASKDAQ